MDNERPIEKLLRDYAKKRRADVGEPREIHPATRRLLQGEVARQFPKPNRSGSSFAAVLSRWRPTVVYGICALAVVAVSVTLLSPIFRQPNPESQIAKARLDESAADKHLQAAAPTPTPAARGFAEVEEKLQVRDATRANEAAPSAPTLADAVRAKGEADNLKPDADKAKSQPARSMTSDTLRNAPAAPTSAPQVASLDQSANRAIEPQSRLEPSTREARRTVSEIPASATGGISLASRPLVTAPAPVPATAPGAAGSPEAAAFNQRYGIPASASASDLRNSAQLANTAKFRRSTSAETDASPVLTTFQFEQTGEQLRVIDGDGSTYVGALTPPPVDAYARKVELKDGANNKASDAAALRADSPPKEFSDQAGQNYAFRVTGTNRTLQQRVVFTGNILILTNALPAGQTVLTQAQGVRSRTQFAPQQNQLPNLQHSTVSGNVQLGTGKEVKINAVQVNP